MSETFEAYVIADYDNKRFIRTYNVFRDGNRWNGRPKVNDCVGNIRVFKNKTTAKSALNKLMRQYGEIMNSFKVKQITITMGGPKTWG